MAVDITWIKLDCSLVIDAIVFVSCTYLLAPEDEEEEEDIY